MEKKKQRQKAIQERLGPIIKIYVRQKGKSKRRLLKDFIEQKTDEIIAYSENLRAKTMEDAESEIAVPGNIAAAAIQPSPTLIEELHNTQSNHLQLQGAGNN